MVGGRRLGAGEQRGWSEMRRRSREEEEVEVQRGLAQRPSSSGPQRSGCSCGDGPDWCRGVVGNTRGEGMGGRPLGSGRFPGRWQDLARRGAVSKAFLLGPGRW